MRMYKINFQGRYVGSTGITYALEAYGMGESKEDALKSLYQWYEHISPVGIEEITGTKRQKELLKHYKTLERFADFTQAKTRDGKKLSLGLYKLEQKAHKLATDWCNGENGVDSNKWDLETEKIIKEIETLFGCKVPGLFINGDARGYAIKIDDLINKNFPRFVDLHTDWGGYGILSPEV